MKRSIYSSLIRLTEGQYLAYGAYQDKYLSIPAELLSHGDIEKVEEDTLLYGKLVESGILVDDTTDEVSELLAASRRIDDDPSRFILHINPTLNCNFRCWYCYESHVVGSRMETDVREAVVRLVRRKMASPGVDHLSLSFFGGEPLMYFDQTVRPLLDAISGEIDSLGKTMSVHFTTNGYMVTDEMVEYLSRYNTWFQITLDGGRDHHNRTRDAGAGRSSYDVILANIRKLADAALPVLIRINYTEENLPSVGDIVAEVSSFTEEQRRHVSVDLQRVWQDRGKGFSEDVADKVEGYARAFMGLGVSVTWLPLRASYRSPCYGDRRHYVLVNYNGDVYHCTARDFASSRRSGALNPDGTISWDSDFHAERLGMKLSKEVCRDCRIAPLCMGGCCQRNYETRHMSACPNDFTEADKDRVVLDRFRALHMN